MSSLIILSVILVSFFSDLLSERPNAHSLQGWGPLLPRPILALAAVGLLLLFQNWVWLLIIGVSIRSSHAEMSVLQALAYDALLFLQQAYSGENVP